MTAPLSGLYRNVARFLGNVAQSKYSAGGSTVTGGEMKGNIAVLKLDGDLDKRDQTQLRRQFLDNPEVNLDDEAFTALLEALGLGGGGGGFPIQPMYGVLIGELTAQAVAEGDSEKLDMVITAAEKALDRTPSAELSPMTMSATATSSAVSKRAEVEDALAAAKAARAEMS